MTSPDVPLRMEITVEVPGTPEQVWDAIATGGGISSWFLTTDLEERQGGTIVTYMGEDDQSPGVVTGWEPPHRFAYEEPDWAGLVGHPDAAVTPIVSEFLVEARSGGSCVVRVVSSAFGTGADWQGEFFEDMERHWQPFFDNLRLYLAYFPGQRATVFEASANLARKPEDVLSGMQQALGLTDVGQQVDLLGLPGVVERIGDEKAPLTLVRLSEPQQGMMMLSSFGTGEGTAVAAARGYLFSDDAQAVADREQPRWKAWLEGLAV